jgi:hypothetical protein
LLRFKQQFAQALCGGAMLLRSPRQILLDCLVARVRWRYARFKVRAFGPPFRPLNDDLGYIAPSIVERRADALCQRAFVGKEDAGRGGQSAVNGGIRNNTVTVPEAADFLVEPGNFLIEATSLIRRPRLNRLRRRQACGLAQLVVEVRLELQRLVGVPLLRQVFARGFGVLAQRFGTLQIDRRFRSLSTQ